MLRPRFFAIMDIRFVSPLAGGVMATDEEMRQGMRNLSKAFRDMGFIGGKPKPESEEKEAEKTATKED